MENSVRGVVSALITDRFPDAKILEIEILEDFDDDDDEILRVRVVFESEKQTLDSKATSSFLRYLRPKLSEIGVNMFPVMSFISSKDDSGVAA